MLLDLLPDNDKFTSIKELRNEGYCFQGGLCQWVRHLLDKTHHPITVEGLSHIKRHLHKNQHHLSSGSFTIVIRIATFYIFTYIVMEGPMLLELVQYLVGLCSEGNSNKMLTKEACQCLGLIGIRDFGAVSLQPKHIGKIYTCTHISCHYNYITYAYKAFMRIYL